CQYRCTILRPAIGFRRRWPRPPMLHRTQTRSTEIVCDKIVCVIYNSPLPGSGRMRSWAQDKRPDQGRKTMSNSRINSLLRGASLAFASMAAFAAPAFAQDATADNDGDIVVTGTRLRGVAPVCCPLQSITSQRFEDA